MEYIIQTHQLTKRYTVKPVINLTFAVKMKKNRLETAQFLVSSLFLFVRKL